MDSEFEYTRLSPEELANSLDVVISSGSSLSNIQIALKKGEGLVYIIDGFKVYLHHEIHRFITKENGIPEEQTVMRGTIYGKFRKKLEVTLDYDRGNMASMFGIPYEKIKSYADAIKEKVRQEVAKLI